MKTAGKNKKAERQASKKKSKTDSGKDIGEEMLKINKTKPEKKRKKPEAVEEVVLEKVLPTVESDKKLEAIVETAQKAEKKSRKEDEVDDSSAFLSISTPAEDGVVPKVPSYSSEKNRGIVYISHIPHGFYEKQMREFFAQFGTVTNLRLGRSKKTGRSCGFAFVEFKYKEVAKVSAVVEAKFNMLFYSSLKISKVILDSILSYALLNPCWQVVSETMNNYLMFDKILKVSLLPEERMSPAVFRGKVLHIHTVRSITGLNCVARLCQVGRPARLPASKPRSFTTRLRPARRWPSGRSGR